MRQLHEPGGALDQSADLRGVVLVDDLIALPMPGHGAVVSLAGALRDVDHARDPAAGLTATPMRLTHRGADAQTLGQLTAQLTAAGTYKTL
jgi:hypothetical protein